MQVGIPLAIANEMSIPVHVAPNNIDELKAMARNGPERPSLNHPCGANYVIRPDKRRLRLAEGNLDTVADMIEPGWTVERQLTGWGYRPFQPAALSSPHEYHVPPGKGNGWEDIQAEPCSMPTL